MNWDKLKDPNTLVLRVMLRMYFLIEKSREAYQRMQQEPDFQEYLSEPRVTEQVLFLHAIAEHYHLRRHKTEGNDENDLEKVLLDFEEKDTVALVEIMQQIQKMAWAEMHGPSELCVKCGEDLCDTCGGCHTCPKLETLN